MVPYIILAIVAFGLLIAVHELGHFMAAKALGVRVNEFAIGMGPRLLHRHSGETEYTLRLLPVGGYCAMEGEDEDSDDPRSFGSQKGWKKFIILVAGSAMNFVAGFVLLLVLFGGHTTLATPVIDGFMDGFPLEGEQGLMVGDEILSIDGEAIYIYDDVSFWLGRSDGVSVDMVVERNGESLERKGLPLTLREYTDENGEQVERYGFYFATQTAAVGDRISYSWWSAINFVRLVRVSLTDLASGRAGINDLSGPVGMVTMLGEIGSESETAAIAFQNILYFTALIAVNLAVMNLLPLPALDGGRIFFLVVNGLCYAVTRRKIDPKYEGYIHMVGLALLLALMLFVSFQDVIKIVR